METVGVSKTSLRFYQCTRTQSPEDSNIDSRHNEERKILVFMSIEVNTSVIISVASVWKVFSDASLGVVCIVFLDTFCILYVS